MQNRNCGECGQILEEWETGFCEVCHPGTQPMPAKLKTRTIALTDAARIKTALTDAGVRVAIQIDGDDAQLIYLADDAQAAADAIAAELTR